MNVGAQFRDRQRRDINPVEMQGQVIRCEVVRDDEIPAVASAVLFGLDCELIFAYLFVIYLLLTLPIYIDINVPCILLFAYARCTIGLFLLSGQEILYSRSIFEEAYKDNAEGRVNNRVGQVAECSDHVH